MARVSRGRKSSSTRCRRVELKVFEPSVIPNTAVCLMAIDVQVKGFWVLVRKFAPPSAERPYGESWLLFADFVETIEECKEIQGEYEIADDCVTMDMARKPNAVGRMIIDHNWLGVWGSDTRKFAHPDPMNPARKLPADLLGHPVPRSLLRNQVGGSLDQGGALRPLLPSRIRWIMWPPCVTPSLRSGTPQPTSPRSTPGTSTPGSNAWRSTSGPGSTSTNGTSYTRITTFWTAKAIS
jgi:hypothetical protein